MIELTDSLLKCMYKQAGGNFDYSDADEDGNMYKCELDEHKMYDQLKRFNETRNLADISPKYRKRFKAYCCKVVPTKVKFLVFEKRVIQYNGKSRDTGRFVPRLRVQSKLDYTRTFSLKDGLIRINRQAKFGESMAFWAKAGYLDYLIPYKRTAFLKSWREGMNIHIRGQIHSTKDWEGLSNQFISRFNSIPYPSMQDFLNATNYKDLLKETYGKSFPKGLLKEVHLADLGVMLHYCTESELQSLYGNAIKKGWYSGHLMHDHLDMTLKAGEAIKIDHKSREEFSNHHKYISDRVQALDKEELNPKPWYPEQLDFNDYKVRLIQNRKQLLREGDHMKHCIGSYTNNINRGTCAIYAVTKGDWDSRDVDERWTLQVHANKQGDEYSLVCNQARGFANEVSSTIKRFIREFDDRFIVKKEENDYILIGPEMDSTGVNPHSEQAAESAFAI